MQQQISFLDSQFGKMFPELSAVTKEKTSEASSKASATSATDAMFLDLRTANGATLVPLWETVGALPGESTTHNTGESPSVVRESTLSQILDLNAPEKYSLSPRACQGILNRAERRGKVLPDMLRDALMEVVSSSGATGAEADE